MIIAGKFYRIDVNVNVQDAQTGECYINFDDVYVNQNYTDSVYSTWKDIEPEVITQVVSNLYKNTRDMEPGLWRRCKDAIRKAIEEQNCMLCINIEYHDGSAHTCADYYIQAFV